MTKAQEKPNTEKQGVDRRAFLRGAGIAAGAAGVAAVTASPEAEAAPAADNHKSVGYRETDHVRRAYDLARF